MGKHKLFGGIAADSFSVGDIVQWSSWNMQKQNWDENYGIITDISSVFKSNRLVSVSKATKISINPPHTHSKEQSYAGDLIAGQGEGFRTGPKERQIIGNFCFFILGGDLDTSLTT